MTNSFDIVSFTPLQLSIRFIRIYRQPHHPAPTSIRTTHERERIEILWLLLWFSFHFNFFEFMPFNRPSLACSLSYSRYTHRTQCFRSRTIFFPNRTGACMWAFLLSFPVFIRFSCTVLWITIGNGTTIVVHEMLKLKCYMCKMATMRLVKSTLLYF